MAWYYVYKPIDSPREGFTTGTTIDTSYAMKDGTSTNSYTIFDPTAAYLQAGIYAMEYGPSISAILKSEEEFTRTTLPYLISKKESTVTTADYDLITQDVLRNIANLGINVGTDEFVRSASTAKQYSKREGASDRLVKPEGETYKELHNRLDDPTAYYKTRDANFLRIYDRTPDFINNPIGFIVSGKKLGKLYMNCGYKTMKKDAFSLIKADMFSVSKNALSSHAVGTDGPREYTLDKIYNLFNVLEVSRYKYDSTKVHLDPLDTERCYPYEFEPFDYTSASRGELKFQKKCPADSYHRRPPWGGMMYSTCTGGLGGGIIIQSEEQGKYRHDGDEAPKFIIDCYHNGKAVSHASKFCKEIPGEIADPSIPTTILSNPATWALRSFIRPTSPEVTALINGYNAGRVGPYNTISVVGMISTLAKAEVKKSIAYAMYFNFTDTSKIETQILVASTPPCNLFMSKINSASVEFSTNMATKSLDISTLGVASNAINANTPITNDMMKMLPYHTRNYIRRWAISRRERVASWHLQKCNSLNVDNPLKNEAYNRAQIFIDQGPYWGGTSQRIRDSYTPTFNQLNISCSANDSTKSLMNEYTVYMTAMNITPGPTIQNRTYSEIYPYYISTSTSSPTLDVSKANVASNYTSEHDVAPKFDLMSVSNTDPAVFSAATPNMVISLTNTTAGSPYSISMTISQNIAFLSTSMNIALTDMSDPTTYLNARVASYTPSSGQLSLDNILVNNVYVNGSMKTGTQLNPWTPFGNTAKYYQISYTNIVNTNTFIGTDSEIKTIYAQKITPVIGTDIDLIINLTQLLPATTVITVSNYSEPTTYFNATVTSYTPSNNNSSATLKVKPSSNPLGSYEKAVTYIISLGSSSLGSSNGRYWLSLTEKRTILNMIAQFYYENSNNTEMNMILDVFQVGDLLYDVRFIDLRRNTTMTEDIASKMDSLRTKHQTYRELLLSEDQRIKLEDEYNTQMINLNTQLSNALYGIGDDCGILKPQKVRLKRTDTSTTGISLAQIIIVDNTGSNAAYTRPVTTNSTYIPRYLVRSESSDVRTTTAESGVCIISSTGAINCTKDGTTTTIAPPGTCLNVQGTPGNYTSKNCSTIGSAVTVTPTASSGNSSANTLLLYKQNQLLTDGNYTAIRSTTEPNTVTFTWNTTPWGEPYYYKSSGSSINEYVEIDLLSPTDITSIYIIYPTGYTEIPTYSVELYNTEGIKIDLPTGYASTITRASSSSDSSKLSLLKLNRSPNLPACINSLNEPYTVARFYSTIDKDVYNNNSGNPVLQLTALRFTGYSLGVKAALTFNPKYNAGFVVDMTSGLGNTNYRPSVTYTKNAPTTANPLPQNDLCLQIPRAKNIIYDHYTSLQTYEFTERPDIKDSSRYDTSEYVYKPLKILGLAKNSDESCGIKWSEIKVNAVTNVRDSVTKEYYGIFKYQTNYENWGAIDSYYDITNSRMFDSQTEYSNGGGGTLDLGKTADFTIDLPREGTLDNLGGACPSKSCSDIDVINSIVQSYNEDTNNTLNKIIRITQAVTVSETRCDFRGIIQTPTGTTSEIPFTMDVQTQIKMSSGGVNSLDLSNTECKHYYKSIKISGGGDFIQSNTPYLLKSYNYASETIQPYIKFFNNTTYKSLFDTVSNVAPQLRNSLLTYRKDMYGAYGQLNTLTGGTCKETDTRNVCSDPATINEFMKAYRKYRILNSANDPGFISSVTHAGTAYNNTCDYVVNTYTLSVNSSSVPVTTNPQTLVYRVKMNPIPDTCYFTTTVDSTSNITSSANTDINYENLTVINYTGDNYVAAFLGTGTGTITSTSITSLVLTISRLKISYNQPVSIQYGGASLNGYITSTTATSDTSTSVATTSITISNVFNVGSFPSGSLTLNIYTSNILCQARASISNPQPDQSILFTISVLLNDSYIGTPVIVRTSSVSMNGVIQFYSATTITIGSVSNVQGTFTDSLTNYTIVVNHVKQIQLNTVPTALNRNTWETPVTLGTQTVTTTLVFTSSNTVTLNVPSLQYTLNREVYIVDMNNSTNNFNAVMKSYVTSTLTLGSVRNKNGSFSTPTKYRIFSIVPSILTSSVPLVEMIDYVDCVNNPYTRGSTNLSGKAFQCSNGVTFSQSNDPAVNSVVSGSSSVSPASITLSIPLTSPFLQYPDVVTSVNPARITGTTDTYEFRVTTQNYLPYGDTYKIIQFYNTSPVSVPKILKVSNSNGEISNFSFFTKYSIVTNLNKIISCARDSWNILHLSASEGRYESPILGSQTVDTVLTLSESTTTITLNVSPLQYTENLPVTIIDINNSANNFNAIMKSYTGSTLTLESISNINGVFGNSTKYKIVVSNTVTLAPTSLEKIETIFKSVIKTIDQYFIPANKNIIIFRGTAADFGVNGENDIRAYSTTRYFEFEFREKLNTGDLVYNSVPTVNADSRNPVWNLNPNNTFFVYAMREVKYTLANLPTFISISPNTDVVPTGTKAVVVGSSTAIARKATYVVQSLTSALTLTKKFKYLRLKFTSSATSTLNYAEITYINFYSTNVPSTNYAFITSSANTVQLQYASFTVEGILPIRYYLYGNNNTCDIRSYTQSTDANGTTFGVCTLKTPPSITLLTRTFRYNNFNYVLPCPIGYESNSATDNVCLSTGNYKKVNLILESVPNPTTQRMKLPLNKYLYINLNDEVQINYFTFTTGASSARPTGWILEGSMSGNPSKTDEWIPLHSSSGYTYSEAGPIYSFIQTSCFPILTGGQPIRPTSASGGLGYDFTNDPSTGTTLTEGFKNPTKSLLNDSAPPVFETQSVPKLEFNYSLPLQTGVIPKYTLPERRIQYLRFTITQTRKQNSPFVHMSMLQFITPLGPLPKNLYTISNPMGVHPYSKTGPEALGSPTERWVNLNRNPLLIKFGILPPTIIQGFQFTVPLNVKNSEDSVPSEWIIESSYDGRFWEMFEQTEGPMVFNGQTSPVYTFIKQI
jgi:hypothetical protein